eukprot:5467045-Alexandrium_andersonii.AAC.1
MTVALDSCCAHCGAPEPTRHLADRVLQVAIRPELPRPLAHGGCGPSSVDALQRSAVVDRE